MATKKKKKPSEGGSLGELRQRIIDEIPFIDVKPYSHNIIGIVLQQIADGFGHEEALKAIKELGLDKKGWTQK